MDGKGGIAQGGEVAMCSCSCVAHLWRGVHLGGRGQPFVRTWAHSLSVAYPEAFAGWLAAREWCIGWSGSKWGASAYPFLLLIVIGGGCLKPAGRCAAGAVNAVSLWQGWFVAWPCAHDLGCIQFVPCGLCFALCRSSEPLLSCRTSNSPKSSTRNAANPNSSCNCSMAGWKACVWCLQAAKEYMLRQAGSDQVYGDAHVAGTVATAPLLATTDETPPLCWHQRFWQPLLQGLIQRVTIHHHHHQTGQAGGILLFYCL